MQSLNSFQQYEEREKIITNPVDTTITKNNLHLESDSSSFLLNNKRIESRNDISSPDIPGGGNMIFKPFAKLIIYFHIATFVKKFQRYFKPDGSFQDKHFFMIDDKAAGNSKDFLAFKSRKQLLPFGNYEDVSWKFQIRYKLRQRQKQIHQILEKCFMSIPLMDPCNKYKVIWDIIINCMRIYLLYAIPIIITFEELVESYSQSLIISSLCFFVDMGFRMFTIYFEQGLPVKDRYKILNNQLTSHNIIEITSIFCVMMFVNSKYDAKDNFVLEQYGAFKLILLLNFCQILNILSFIDTLSQSRSFGKLTTSLSELARFIGILLLVQHISACIWIIVGRNGLRQNQNNWITANGDQDLVWNDLYVEGLYYISVTMFTVGYGDIHPENKTEKIFAFLFVFICAFQTSYSLNTIGHLLQQIKKENEIINQKLIFINQYMHNKKISSELQLQIREYLYYFWHQEQRQQTTEQILIMDQLSEDLRNQLAYESNKAVFSQCEFLIKHFSNSFQNDLMKKLKFQTFQPSTQINISDGRDKYLQIVESGEVKVYEKRDCNCGHLIQVGTYKKGNYFNLELFFSNNQKHRMIFKSNGFVSTLVIPFSQFYQTLEQHPDDMEKYWDIREKMTSQQFSLKGCVSCDSNKHQSDECRQVHYIPDKEKVLKSFIFNQIQERSFFIRNRNRIKNYFNAKTDCDFFKEAAQMVRQGNDSTIFQKWYDPDETSPNEPSRSVTRKESRSKSNFNSISLLIKEFESKTYLPDPIIEHTEKKLSTSTSRPQGINEEEYQTLAILNQKLRNQQLYNDHDIEQMEYTSRKIEIKYNCLPLPEFEMQKEYKYYNNQHNISQILKKPGRGSRKISYKNSNSYDTIQLNQASYWLKYMFFPFDFLYQYRCYNPNDLKKSDKVNVRHRRLSKTILQRRIEKKWLFRKALQVHPAE